ncbi:MAG TPA: mandelate racemase/muconate lactonizing enzyme family protein [Burkholderiales bacterium]|nr:mandelate racemase/muconate lactonizing enzyme family protein [Burkholderiales bacterium]
MKITGLKTHLVKLPGAPTLAGIPDKADQYTFVTLQLRTDEGVEGVGITFFGGGLAATLKSAVDQLGALTVGEDPLRPEAVVEKLRAAAKGCGPAGIFTLACTAIDTALWDIKGKALNQPVWKLLGGFRDRVPCYASGALTRDLTLDEVVGAGPKLVDKGFRQMKTQMALPGKTNARIEADRMRRVREAIGPDIDLMCDINQRWSVAQAISFGKRVEEVGLYWLEDVTTADDFAGLARVTAALDTPVAGGEYLYGPVPFRHMMEARSVDIVMVDLMRAGGPTQWVKIAAMAEAFNQPIVSHLVPEIHVHLVAAVPNGLTVEYMPRSLRLWKETPKIEDGMLVAPQKPGLGLEFDPEIINRYAQ